MAEHYTRNTVAVKKYCPKCRAFTMHNVHGGQVGGCQACIAKPADPKPAPAATQESLF